MGKKHKDFSIEKKVQVYHLGANYIHYSKSGKDRMLTGLIDGLSQSFEFHVVDFKKELKNNSYIVEKLENVTIHKFGPRRFRGMLLPKRFYKWLLGVSPNAIFHLHGAYKPSFYRLAKILNRNKFKFILSPHLSYIESINNSPLYKKYFKKFYFVIFEKKLLESAKKLHLLCDKHELELIDFTQIFPIVIPNTTKDYCGYKDFASVGNYICFIGRLNIVHKGIDLMISAYALYKKQSKTKTGKLIIICPNDKNKLKKIELLCKKEDIILGEDLVIAAGITEDEKNAILRRAKAGILLSRYEGLPITAIEMLESGTPIIVSNNIELYKNQINEDCIFLASTQQEAAGYINDVLEMNNSRYEKICFNARNVYDRNFGEKSILERFKKLYAAVTAP